MGGLSAAVGSMALCRYRSESSQPATNSLDGRKLATELGFRVGYGARYPVLKRRELSGHLMGGLAAAFFLKGVSVLLGAASLP